MKNKIKYLSTNYSHIIAINYEGIAYSWGSNQYYQLGLGFTSKYEYIPRKISGGLETKTIVMCVCQEKFSAILTDNGEVWTFGHSN